MAMANQSKTAAELLAEQLLARGFDDFSAHERRVIRQCAQRLATARNLNVDFEEGLTLGQRMADAVARFGGSWTFISLFGIFLVTWAVINGLWLGAARAFDPYPFIFLNLMLSMLAAVQAPIIMMSQNRQAEKDRLTAAHDYEVNLKAELEIMALHEKLDRLRDQELKSLIERVELLVAQR
jgi:uncharacterized membrane protein